MKLNNWISYSLAELFDISSGLSKGKEFFGKGDEFLSFKDIFNNYFVPEQLDQLVDSTEKEQQKCSIKRGDIFLTRTSEKMDELGMSSVALKDYEFATFNGFSKRLRLKSDKQKLLHPEYAGFLFRSSEFRNQITSMSSMSTRASLNNEMISRLTINLPSLDEQIAIADILYKIHQKAELNFKLIAKLEELSEMVFKQWFIDFEFPNEEDQPYKSSGGKIVESELGMMPEGWEVQKLDDISSVRIGKTPPRKESQWFTTENNGIRWVSIKDMGNTQSPYILDSSEKITHEAKQRFNINVVPKNTVIMSFKLTVGRLNITAEDLVTNEAIASFDLQDSKLFSQYLYLTLKNYDFNSLGNTSSIGTAVNSKVVKKMKVLVPSTKALNLANEQLIPIFKLMQEKNKEILNLNKLKETLLPKLLSGEIEVPVREPKSV